MSYASTILADSPLSYWRLGESAGSTATDQQAAHNGTYTGGTFSQAGLLTGDPDTAVFFPASDTDHVQASTAHIVGGLTNFSIECWLKIASFSTTVTMYCERASAAGNDIVRFDLNTATILDLVYRDTAGTLNTINSGTFASIADSNPHHLVVTKTGTAILFYVDGVQQTGGSLTATDTLSETTPSWIAWDPQNGALANAMTLDEVAVYNVALSSGQVSAHYTAGVIPDAPLPPAPFLSVHQAV